MNLEPLLSKIDGLLNIILVIREKIIAFLTDFGTKYSQRPIGKIVRIIHPNLITISRGTFFPFFTVHSLIDGNESKALIYWILGWLTDPLDGPWAIITNRLTKAGKILDPLCDRIFFLAVIITTIAIDDLILLLKIFLALTLLLELLLPALYLLAKLEKRPIILAHNKYGKISTILIAFALPLIWFSEHSENWQFILGGIISATTITSLINIGKHIKAHLTFFR
jgi:phosphatidylglycerophosphate synthase